MSGSNRAIVLRLSVRDADVVRTQLMQMGDAGEQALAKLDAAARKAVERGGALPRIGQAANDAGTAADRAGGRFGNFGQKIGQAGFQIQDFAVQVQGGTSALTALSQQGAQLLGVFGTGGAIAGAVLTVGLLAARLFGAADASKTWEDALKRQQDALKAAQDEAERWRKGLEDEARRVQDLRDHYDSLSEARRSFEMRATQREQEAIRARETELRRSILGHTSGLVAGFQGNLDDAARAAQQYPAGSAERAAFEEFIATDRDLQRMREAIAAIEQFRASGNLSVDALANLTQSLRDISEGSDPVSRRLRELTAEMDKQAPEVRELAEAQAELDTKLRALGQQAGGAADRLEELRRRMVALRDFTLQNPTAGLDAEVARTAERAAALARGGVPLFERVESLQQEQDAARRFARQAEEDFRRGLRGMSEDDIRAAVERERPSFVARGMELAASQAELERRAKEARDKQRAAERGGRSTLRSEDREFERADDLVRNLREQVALQQQAADLERHGPRAAAAADLEAKIAKATDRMRELAAETQNPTMREAITAQIVEVDRLIREEERARQARRDNRALYEQDSVIETLQAEMALVGATVDLRERELAALKERQRIIREGGDPDSDAGQRRIARARQIADMQREFEDLQATNKQVTAAFSNFFEGIITGSDSAADAFRRLDKALADIIIRMALLKPLENAIGGIDFGGMIGKAVGSIFGGSSYGASTGAFYGSGPDYTSASGGGFLFADGGIMTSRGPVPLRRYAGGGVARSPQLALFGEGDMAEAYVPLPDGRSIPVTMEGGGGITIVQHNNIDARGADASVMPRIQAALAANKEQTKAELLATIGRGGPVSKAVGRRR